MSEPQLTGQELQRMADALPAEFMWGDPLYPLDLREILSAMGYFDLLAALQSALKTAEFEHHPVRAWHHEARDAIALALGEPTCTTPPSTPS